MLLIYILGLWNLISVIICYRILRKKRVLYDDRFAMTLTMTTTMVSTLVICLHVTVILPLQLTSLFFLNLLIGIMIGCLFGSLVKFHSILTGLYSGAVGSSMGVMMGEVLKDPALCKIPLESGPDILLNLYQLSGFTTLLLSMSLSLILYSLKV